MDFVDSVSDPLYGRVMLTKLEHDIIATAGINRLRRIKQLGLANWVYPSANHSRFEHMIGVLHLTYLLLDELCRRNECRVNPDERQSIRLAGLLHDIGHGPFSHTFEEILKLRLGLDHDAISGRILKSPSMQDLLGKRRIQTIRGFLIRGASIGDVPGEIITGDIGTDRMDYLIRDTYYTGLGHRPDINSIVSSLHLIKNFGSGRRIAVSPEDISCIELITTTKYHHFSMIAHRKECRGFELLLLKAIDTHLQRFSSSSKQKAFVLRTFSELDDAKLLAQLESPQNRYVKSLEAGDSFSFLFRIKLGDIRSDVSRYCLYRLYRSNASEADYRMRATSDVSGILPARYRDHVFVDLNFWNHDVPDVISFRGAYKTQNELFSALLCDESLILRSIAGAEASSSTLSVYTDLKNSAAREWIRQKLDRERSSLLALRPLVIMTSKLVNKHGPTKADKVLLFLYTLIDLYKELKKSKSQSLLPDVPYLRGITRLNNLVSKCGLELKMKQFSGPTGKDRFKYSPELFSILNALHYLDFIEITYQDDPSMDVGLRGKTYFIKIKKTAIRRYIFDVMPVFLTLRGKYLSTLKSGGLHSTLKKFYAGEDMRLLDVY